MVGPPHVYEAEVIGSPDPVHTERIAAPAVRHPKQIMFPQCTPRVGCVYEPNRLHDTNDAGLIHLRRRRLEC